MKTDEESNIARKNEEDAEYFKQYGTVVHPRRPSSRFDPVKIVGKLCSYILRVQSAGGSNIPSWSHTE